MTIQSKKDKHKPSNELLSVNKKQPIKKNNKPIDKKITRFGYIINKKSLSDNKLDEVRQDLTVKPYKPGNFGFKKKDDSFPVYVENGDYIGVPKYYGLEKFGEPDINRLDTYNYPKCDMKFTGKLRPRQEIIVQNVLKGYDEHYNGGLLVAGCGSGKTLLAIYIACHFGLKTLFIVHKNFLKNQFIDRVKSCTNVKHVGTIQRKKVDIDHPFVVGMVHSLAKINYDDEIFKDFGMIIIDEVHHMGARNFSKVYQKMSAKYMLGISAERRRTDGLYKIINWYMGPFLHIEEQKPNDMVVVKKIHYKTNNKERSKVIINKYTKEPDRSTMTTNLVKIKSRNRLILNMIMECYDAGKNVLCLSGRLKQINLLYKLLEENEYTRGCVGKYIGSMSEDELAKSATKQIILGTYEMASEGLDIENLNVVFLCTPKSAIRQSVGRILRKDVYEEHPIVVDFVDEDNTVFKRQANTRDSYYKQQHYNIQDFYFSDYKLEKYSQWNNEKAITEAIMKVPEKNKYGNKSKRNDQPKKFSGPVNIDDIDFMDD